MRAIAVTGLAGLILLLAVSAAPAQNSSGDLADSKTVSDYLARCGKDRSFCYADVVSWAVGNDSKKCIPDNLSDAKLAGAIVNWLQAHPEKSSDNPYDAISAAAAAIWPCQGGR